MGCCQSDNLGTEIIFSQANTLDEVEGCENFQEIPLSSSSSPLKYSLIQEVAKSSTIRLSYETTVSSSIPNSRLSLELSFACSRL